MELVTLHNNLKYLDACAELLNEEWPRSKTARLHSLEKSCDELPTCLILLDEQRTLVGHSRLSDIRGRQRACLVESVIVWRSERGKGYGREVMKATERHAKSKGFEWLYLTTHDKQQFYQKLGYQFCDPVVSVGGDFSKLPETFMKALAGLSQGDRDNETRHQSSAPSALPSVRRTQQSSDGVEQDKIGNPEGCAVSGLNEDSVSVPSPLPTSSLQTPAPPPSTDSAQTASKLAGNHPAPTVPPPPPTDAPPPPPPPAHPPPPPPPPVNPPPQTAGSKPKVVRWDPSKVSWMRKLLDDKI